jgi:hypothetical protein
MYALGYRKYRKRTNALSDKKYSNGDGVSNTLAHEYNWATQSLVQIGAN